MKPSLSVSIPKPCSENWNSFTTTSTGGFCGSCQKNVIDFTKATDEEIIAFINHKPEHACGRFRIDQLKTYAILPEVKIRPGFMLLKAGILSLLMLFISKQTSAQSSIIKQTTEIGGQQKRSEKPVENYETLVRGVVTSITEKTPVPGVTVVQKGTVNGVITDSEGRYELKIDRRNGQVLVFSFIGLETEELFVPESSSITIDIAMEDGNSVFSGELIITGEPQGDELYREQQSGLKKFWTKIKNLF